jgi:hypothetical protein
MKGSLMADAPGSELAVSASNTLSPEIEHAFAEMITAVPEDDGNAMDSILTEILKSAGWENLSDPWESASAEKLAGHTLRFDRITRHDSTIAGGFAFFLVAHYTDTRTGEAGVWPTSSIAVMAQLVRAHLGGWLPLFGQVVIAERPTKNGFKPQHIKFLGKA